MEQDAYIFYITPTNRLATDLRRTEPLVMSVNEWVQTLWQRGQRHGIVSPLINKALKRYWWQQIIESDYEQSHVWPTANTVQQAISAYHLVLEWQLSLDEIQQSALDNVKCFVRWLQGALHLSLEQRL